MKKVNKKADVKVRCLNCHRPIVQKSKGRIRYYCDNGLGSGGSYCKAQARLRRLEMEQVARDVVNIEVTPI